MQLVVALACLAVSVGLGLGHLPHSVVDGWQLWLWLILVGMVAACLIPPRASARPRLVHGRWLLGLFVCALALRALALDALPPGLYTDELGSAGYTVTFVFPGDDMPTANPFQVGPNSHPTLYYYILRLCFALFGYTIPALRISSAVAGAMAVLATYACVAVFHNRRAALLAAAIMTTLHFHVHWSRIGLNNIWDTLWIPTYLAAFAWGWQREWSGGAVIAGLALGLSQYFYPGNKVGVLLLVVAIAIVHRNQPDRLRLLIHGGKLALTTAVVASPLVLFAVYAPEVFFARLHEVMGWHTDAVIAAVGSYDLWAYAKLQVVQNIAAFVAVADASGFHGADVPIMVGLAAPLFVVGLLWELMRRRWLPVLWIALTLVLGGIMTKGAPSSYYFVGGIPAMCWLVASPLDWLWSRGHARLALVLLAAIMATDTIVYFSGFASSAPLDLHPSLPPWPL